MKNLCTLGKTQISRSYPWGLNSRNGHRVLCADGVLRAVEMAETADTFFSTPARVRIKGKWFSGYVTTEENEKGQSVYSFRQHVNNGCPLPDWPDKFTPEHETLISKAL